MDVLKKIEQLFKKCFVKRDDSNDETQRISKKNFELKIDIPKLNEFNDMEKQVSAFIQEEMGDKKIISGFTDNVLEKMFGKNWKEKVITPKISEKRLIEFLHMHKKNFSVSTERCCVDPTKLLIVIKNRSDAN